MIRFACPGCAAEYTVGVEKAGSEGSCPGCRVAFLIPAAEGGPRPVPPAGSVEAAPCPNCRSRLAVAVGDLGREVECPNCRATFRAAPPTPEQVRQSSRPEPEDATGDDRPRGRRRGDGEDAEPPRRRGRPYPKTSKRVLAGLLAIFLGSLGVHKFYLGYTRTGLMQLLLLLVTCGAFKVVAVVEGILYLTKSDEEFIEQYQVNEKHWF